MTSRILHGHVIDVLRTLPSRSVHMVVTSPPYWGLRAYGTEPQVWGGDASCAHRWGEKVPGDGRRGQRGTSSIIGDRKVSDPQIAGRQIDKGAWCQRCGAWRGEHGQEPTMALWIANEVAIFREVYRVLREDGTLWVNMGDAYATQSNGRSAAATKAAGDDNRTFRDKPFSTAARGKRSDNLGNTAVDAGGAHRQRGAAEGLASKQRLMLPARIALALQDDGWWLRDEIVWAKDNPMPSSVKDRTCPAHEFIHVFSKRPRYFYDWFAVTEAAVSDHPSGNGFARPERVSFCEPDGTSRESEEPWDGVGGQRMKRSVWRMPLEPFPGAHYATFPTALVEPCILAGTPAHGVCPTCAAPYRRIVRKVRDENCSGSGVSGVAPVGKGHPSTQVREGHDVRNGPVAAWASLGWVRSCSCGPAEPVPATVLDIFGGSGTVGLVAEYLGRDSILIELNPKSVEIAEQRIRVGLGRVEGAATPDASDLPLFTKEAA